MLDTLRIGHLYSRNDLAEKWGLSGFNAIARGVYTPSGRKEIVLFVTRHKQASLTAYEDYLSGDILFWEGETKHGADARIVDAQGAGDSIHLFYRIVHHTPFEYMGPIALVDSELRRVSPSRFVFRLLHDQSAIDDLQVREGSTRGMALTEREAVILARLGQGVFRKSLMELWEGRCAVTGLSIPEVFRASHIKPWRDASNTERLDPYNGLLLLPQYDSLFDRGFVSFQDEGGILLAPALNGLDLSRLGVREADRLRFVDPRHRDFLAYHRAEVFKHKEH